MIISILFASEDLLKDYPSLDPKDPERKSALELFTWLNNSEETKKETADLNKEWNEKTEEFKKREEKINENTEQFIKELEKRKKLEEDACNKLKAIDEEESILPKKLIDAKTNEEIENVRKKKEEIDLKRNEILDNLKKVLNFNNK